MDDGRTPELRLAALAAHLAARKLDVGLDSHGLRVRKPQAKGDGAADTISCRIRPEDGGRLWYFTSRGEPIAPAPDPATLGRLLDELTGRQHVGRYARASLQNRTAGRGAPPPSRAPRPAVHSRPPSRRPAVRARRIERRPRGGWLRRVLGSFVVVEGW